MAQNRFYSSLTRRTATTLDPGTSGTTLTVTDTSSFAPLDGSFPYVLLINWGQSDQEVVNVTARPSGTTFTIVRGQDGTTGQAHAAGVTVDHGVSARDFTEAGAHVGAAAGVHGITGSVVGTTATQTLSNKQTSDAFTVGAALSVTTDLSVGGVGQLQFKRKTTNLSISNQATPQSDADFAFPVVVGVYKMSGFLIYNGTVSTTNFTTKWAAPSGAVLDWGLHGPLAGATATPSNLATNVKTLANQSTVGVYGTTSTTTATCLMYGLLDNTAGTSGTFQFQWAQAASNASAITLLAPSYIIVTRVA
ncbi:MAG: hypothetical protein JWP34_4543 [Massilia sp.]|nr:hypothetical protein [Massilia sp.]